ncbi:hypothetical protein SGUI_1789 [Serinicoccus hydrothermalis]|uniref:Lipoprotein n=1 Tax=Serinicoccus hydrothermalis TaxID=1758689 RepID=A0A1B1NCT9_9MICO|nr:hypothetical protein [Serinicoccus hydrothermalis]ANS79185.1 hypothetical protein SGUI_1789 [Serinicoccus hydrothermalis]
MSTRHRHITTIALSGLLLGGLAACGGEDEPAATETESAPEETSAEDTSAPEETTEEMTEEETSEDSGDASGVPAFEELWPTVIDNASNAESMTATIVGSDGEMTIDATLTGQLDDSNFQVDATIDDGTVSIIAVDETYYLNGDEAFWTMAGGEAQAGTLAGQYIEVPPEMGIGETFSLSSLWEEFFAEVPTDASDMQTSTAEMGDVDGTEAYHYVIEDENAEVWVSADGEDNLLRVLIPGESGEDDDLEMNITDWNDAPQVEAPEDAVPIEEVMGGSEG